mmetsp:Transcript_110348/g.351758  ORF Transcript_110348/g.351758 Transcript_110348/m.351758 type:complete len:243 (+) Transcript_110348:1361-2089(+)
MFLVLIAVLLLTELKHLVRLHPTGRDEQRHDPGAPCKVRLQGPHLTGEGLGRKGSAHWQQQVLHPLHHLPGARSCVPLAHLQDRKQLHHAARHSLPGPRRVQLLLLLLLARLDEILGGAHVRSLDALAPHIGQGLLQIPQAALLGEGPLADALRKVCPRHQLLHDTAEHETIPQVLEKGLGGNGLEDGVLAAEVVDPACEEANGAHATRDLGLDVVVGSARHRREAERVGRPAAIDGHLGEG